MQHEKGSKNASEAATASAAQVAEQPVVPDCSLPIRKLQRH